MNNLNVLIVDDDFNKISSIIKTIKEKHVGLLSIRQASNVQEALEALKKDEFHLLISDLQMPLRHNDEPDDNGGAALIRSIYRKKNNVNVPMYIVGLTQFIQLRSSFQAVWQVWHYDNAIIDWKNNLRDLIFHINLVKSRITTSKIETIYVEGPTDKKIIERAIELYFPEMASKVYIDTLQYGGGASWIERQLFIWAKSLNKTHDDSAYLKAVGLFDDDLAGNKAIQNLRKAIDINSAESKTFSILKSTVKYSSCLKSIHEKGVLLPITLEELISTECWKSANDNGWLQQRNLSIDAFKNVSFPERISCVTTTALISAGFSEDQSLLLQSKIKDDKKTAFCNYVCSLDYKLSTELLISFKFLLTDIFDKLKIPTNTN